MKKIVARGGSPLNKSYLALTESYREYLHILGFSSHTVKGYPQLLVHFLEHLHQNGIYHINDLKPQNVKSYYDYVQTRANMCASSKVLSAASLNKIFDAIDKFLAFLQQQGLTTTPSPTHFRIFQSRAELNQKVKAFSQQEIQTLYSTTTELFQKLSFSEREARRALVVLILDLCYGCGLRRSEAFKLTLSDIDLDKKILFVSQAKGNKDRFVPMSETITKRITVFMYQHRRSFKATESRLFPLSLHSLSYYFKVLLKTSGVYHDEHTGVHILRHSIATHLLQNGMSIEQIAKFLGHATLESTQVYTHLLQEDEG